MADEVLRTGRITEFSGRARRLAETVDRLAHLFRRHPGEERAAAAWITTRAAAVVDSAHRAGGGSSIYVDCPLQRRQRDIHAVTQHFLVKRDTLTTAGAILAGQGPGRPDLLRPGCRPPDTRAVA